MLQAACPYLGTWFEYFLPTCATSFWFFSFPRGHRSCSSILRKNKNYIVAAKQCFFVTVRAGTAYRKIWRLVKNFFCSHNKVHCSEIPIVLSNLLYHYFFHWIMAHFNFVISQNAKWGMPVFTLIATGWRYRKIFFYKKSTAAKAPSYTSYSLSDHKTD